MADPVMPERSCRRSAGSSKDRWVYVALILVLGIFLMLGISEVYRVDGLFSYDPYYHMNLSRQLESEGDIVTEIEYYGGSSPPQYTTSMRLITVLIHQYTDISYLDIYRTFGLFCRVFAALSLFVVAGYFLGDKRYALAAVILFLSAPYIYLRSLITYPENLVLPFHILIFGCIVKGLREDKAPPALALYVSAALYIHYRSLVVPAVLLVLFILFKKSIRYAIVLSAFIAVLSAPVLLYAINQYRSYLAINVGAGATWAPYATGPSYTAPALGYYQGQLGILLLLFTFLGIPFLLRKIDAVKFILLVWLVFTFVLTRGRAVGLYIPTDRMLAYLSVPASLVSALFLKELLEARAISPRVRAAAGFVLALSMVFMLAVSLPTVQGWVGIGGDKRDAAAWVDSNVPEGAVVLPFAIDLLTSGMSRSENLASAEGGWKEVFNAPEGIRKRLQELFPQRDIYIVAGTHELKIHDAEVVFLKGGIRIYYYSGGEG
jgi:hypothetical protein